MRGQQGARVLRVHASRSAVGVAVLAMAALAVGSVLPAAATQGAPDQVTICHRTSSVTNPYTQNTVDRSAADGVDDEHGQGDHYLNHKGPVFDTAKEYTPPMDEDDWGDIIPPVVDFHPGLNWDAAGRAIWKNGCTIVVPPTSTTTTVPPVTTTVPPVTTTVPPVTTTVPPVTTTVPSVTTTVPPVTTTVPPVTTTVPSVTTTEPPASTTTISDPPATGGGGEPPAQGATAPTGAGGGGQGQVPATVAARGNEVPAAMTDGADLAAPSPLGRSLQLAGGLLLLLAARLSVRVEDRP
jgi:hypothetical protein